MIEAPIPSDEPARIATLHSLELLDTSAEERFDRITRLARRLFDVPIALVSLVDSHRQWFKSRQGLDATETPREISFCGHAIGQDEILLVPDARADERFSDNPLVTGEPRVRFYAGCPLAPIGEHRVGTLCIIDHQPREMTEEDLALLRDLAAMVERELATLEMATTDHLTSLSNRRGFEFLAHHTLALAARAERAVTLLYFDLDNLKEINDESGHEEGDRAIVEMSRILLRVFRESDVVARLGGDEFCVLMSGASESDMKRPLEALEEETRARNAAPEARFQLSYSVGIACYEADQHLSLADLQRDADARMYAEKRSKRPEGARRAAGARSA